MGAGSTPIPSSPSRTGSTRTIGKVSPNQTASQGGRIQIVGDDIFVTNPAFISRGIAQKTANAVLIKLNQIGTVTETVRAIELCREAGWGYVISSPFGRNRGHVHGRFRRGHGGGQIKTGSACRSERIAKYNRLIEIERELGPGRAVPLAFCFGRPLLNRVRPSRQ